MFLFTVGSHPLSKDEKIERCLKKIAGGRKEALGELYELTRTAVYGYILSFVKNPADGEDLLQDTYLKIYGNASQYTPMGKPMAWIYTVARNLSLMHIRKQKHHGEMPDYAWEQLAEEPDEVEEVTPRDKAILDAALNKLSEIDRRIVMMHVLGDMKHREIAKELDLPLATVLSKYNRSIKKMQKFMEEEK
ncbi:MAG: RNA polymerase sigma factor [Lachnospiraceae bacterium]|nr:RNA polymerase sigma factor [Lachnospiraceae bacterium]